MGKGCAFVGVLFALGACLVLVWSILTYTGTPLPGHISLNPTPTPSVTPTPAAPTPTPLG